MGLRKILFRRRISKANRQQFSHPRVFFFSAFSLSLSLRFLSLNVCGVGGNVSMCAAGCIFYACGGYLLYSLSSLSLSLSLSRAFSIFSSCLSISLSFTSYIFFLLRNNCTWIMCVEGALYFAVCPMKFTLEASFLHYSSIAFDQTHSKYSWPFHSYLKVTVA